MTSIEHHHPPLGREIDVVIDLEPEWLPWQSEVVSLIRVEGERWAVSCTPFIVQDLHLGDIVEIADLQGGRARFLRRIERGQAWGFRIMPATAEAHHAVHRLIEEHDGAFEIWGRLMSVAIRGDEAADAFSGRLQLLQDRGLLEYATAEQ